MPIHDWSRVDAGIFHHFHQNWIGSLADVLNEELLPEDYYALEEQRTSQRIPDVLTLRERSDDSSGNRLARSAAIQERPKTRYVVESDALAYARKKNRAVVRHVSDDSIVAIVEVLSSGNKASKFEFQRFLSKVFEMLSVGVHLLLIDILPRTDRDPRGIHAKIWEAITDQKLTAPKGLPLTVVSYEADDATRGGYYEPLAVGRSLPNMPLFLECGWHVSVPLERTYQSAYRRVPQRWRKVIETK